VGIVGFVVDAGVLMLIADILGPYVGRLISFVLAVFTTWALNRSFTFNEHTSGLPLRAELRRYFSAMIAGGIANYAIYAALVYFVEIIARWPVIGVGIGSLVGLTINFSLAKKWIFKSER
jgi:putative flippase GtrA